MPFKKGYLCSQISLHKLRAAINIFLIDSIILCIAIVLNKLIFIVLKGVPRHMAA